MTELEQQFEELYQQNADSIYRLCLFKTSNRDVALDLSQDIFTKMWGYLIKGNQVENQRAFLYTVARNRIKDYYKKRKTVSISQTGIESVSEYLPSSLKTSDLAEVQEILLVLQSLPADQAELLQLRYVEEIPIEELAVIYNVRPNTLAVKIHRLVHKLRENL